MAGLVISAKKRAYIQTLGWTDVIFVLQATRIFNGEKYWTNTIFFTI